MPAAERHRQKNIGSIRAFGGQIIRDPTGRRRHGACEIFRACYTWGMTLSSQSTALVPVDPRRRMLLMIREQLMGLHGALIIAEQSSYEGVIGPVGSVEMLLDLLQCNPWFTWLHPFSDLLVRIDHLLDDDTFEISDDNLAHLLGELERLIRPSVGGDGFARAYFEALQRAPDVVLAHFRLKRLLPESA